MSEFFEEWTDEHEQDEQRRRIAAAEQDPRQDYFAGAFTRRPKEAIGQYVQAMGFAVPLIGSKDDWANAFDNGTAMIRSESWQDYSGYSGLLSSSVISAEDTRVLDVYSGVTYEVHRRLGDLVLAAVRDGELSASAYMNSFRWPQQQLYFNREFQRFGAVMPDLQPEASTWEYKPGTNIRIFRDPIIAGRYHLGIRPDDGYVLSRQIEPDEHARVLQQECATRPIVVRGLIDIYEGIRTLPRFDNRQCPLMELQYGDDGITYFLQYLRTGQQLDESEPFSLPEGNHLLSADWVRGKTTPDGEDIRLYISPTRLSKRMKDQAFYFDNYHIRSVESQVYSFVGRMVVHQEGVTLKDNHFNSAPLLRPPVYAGLWNQRGDNKAGITALRKLVERVHGRTVYDKVKDEAIYVNAHITSNGNEARIETDYVPHSEPYTQD